MPIAMAAYKAGTIKSEQAEELGAIMVALLTTWKRDMAK